MQTTRYNTQKRPLSLRCKHHHEKEDHRESTYGDSFYGDSDYWDSTYGDEYYETYDYTEPLGIEELSDKLCPPSEAPNLVTNSLGGGHIDSEYENGNLRRDKCDGVRLTSCWCIVVGEACRGHPPHHLQSDSAGVQDFALSNKQSNDANPPIEEQSKRAEPKGITWKEPFVLPKFVSRAEHWRMMAEKYNFDDDLEIVDPESHEAIHETLRYNILQNSEFAFGIRSDQSLGLGSGASPDETDVWFPYASNSIYHTDNVYSRTAENSTNMHRILKHFDCLREYGLVSDFFSILVARTGAVAEIVPIYRASLVKVVEAMDFLNKNMEVPHGSLYQYGLLTTAQGAVGEITANLGAAFGNHSSLHSEWPDHIKLMADCQWLVRILELGLISYSGSHASRFDEDLLEQETSDDATSVRIIEIPASAMYCSARFSLQRLACLDRLLVHQVWVLGSDMVPCKGNEALSVLTTMPLFSDLWGPVYSVRHTGNEGEILQYNTSKGVIRRQDNDKVPTRIFSRTSGDEVVVPCHWEPAPTHFLSRCADGVRRLLKPPKAFLRDGDLLLIGASEPSPVATPRLQPNKGCQYTSGAFFSDSNEILGVPGTKPTKWVKDGLEIGAGVEMSMFSFSVTGKARKMPGTTLKQRILSKWAQAPARANPWILHHSLAVEVSHCTGNARRVPLRDLLFREDFREYLDVQMPSWTSSDWAVALRQALESSDGEELLRFWKAYQHCRENIGQLVVSILELLDDTGNDGTAFRAALVHQNMEHLVKIPLDKNSWAGILGDTDLSATYAFVTSVCLAPKFDMDQQNDCARCSQDDKCSAKSYTCLQTRLKAPACANDRIRIQGDLDGLTYILTDGVLMQVFDFRSTAGRWMGRFKSGPMHSEVQDSMNHNAFDVTLRSRQKSYGGMSKPRSKIPEKRPCQDTIETDSQTRTNEQPISKSLAASSGPAPKRIKSLPLAGRYGATCSTMPQSQPWPFYTIVDKNCIGYPEPLVRQSYPVAEPHSTSIAIKGLGVDPKTPWVSAKDVVEVVTGDNSKRQ